MFVYAGLLTPQQQPGSRAAMQASALFILGLGIGIFAVYVRGCLDRVPAPLPGQDGGVF